MFNTAPSVSITSPGSFTEQPVAGFGNDFTFTATVTDAEMEGCCEVTWFSTIDGPLGTGNPLTATLYGDGVRTITVTARDDYGLLAQDTVTISLTNQAPEPEITRPEWTPAPPRSLLGKRVPLGAGVPFSGIAPDPNTFFDVPCERRDWVITGPSSTDTIDGCYTNYHPDVLGWHKVQYRATDLDGGTGTDTMWIRAVQWGPYELPYLAISSPPIADYFIDDPDAPLALTAEVWSGTGEMPSVRWVLIDGDETELGTGPSILWTPSDDVGFDCGGRGVEIRAEATDANGTSTDQLPVYVFYPVC